MFTTMIEVAGHGTGNQLSFVPHLREEGGGVRSKYKSKYMSNTKINFIICFLHIIDDYWNVEQTNKYN